MWYVILNPRKRVYNQIAIENLVNPLPPPPLPWQLELSYVE